MNGDKISIEAFGRLRILNGNKEPIQIASLWKEKTAVLVFVRHFG